MNIKSIKNFFRRLFIYSVIAIYKKSKTFKHKVKIIYCLEEASKTLTCKQDITSLLTLHKESNEIYLVHTCSKYLQDVLIENGIPTILVSKRQLV